LTLSHFSMYLVIPLFVASKRAFFLIGYGMSWVSFGIPSVFLLGVVRCLWSLGMSKICYLTPSPCIFK
jgi:hypothetical protein